ncbi:MAG: hypothetical protein LUE98_12810 [Tannerellaceae bacterium]|nr:hypothetical protein [Tannerellaceae bacterium]
MKYCKRTTLTHPLSVQYPKEVELINQIFLTEGFKSYSFEEEVALNLDKIEIKKSKGLSRKATVDLAIGISRVQRNAQILLVELKFEVKRPGNISKKEIEEKIKHSIELLTHVVPVSEKKVLLFNDNIIQQARSAITRLYHNSPKMAIEVKTVEDFKQTYF